MNMHQCFGETCCCHVEGVPGVAMKVGGSKVQARSVEE